MFANYMKEALHPHSMRLTAGLMADLAQLSRLGSKRDTNGQADMMHALHHRRLFTIHVRRGRRPKTSPAIWMVSLDGPMAITV